MWSYWSPIGYLPGWRIGECSPDMDGTGEIKYPGQTKTSTAALRLTEGSVKARGRKPQKKITWSSRLGVVRRASYPSMENICKLNLSTKEWKWTVKWMQAKASAKNTSNKLCIDNIKQDICQMKIKNWIACVQDRGKWKEVVGKAKTFN